MTKPLTDANGHWARAVYRCMICQKPTVEKRQVRTMDDFPLVGACRWCGAAGNRVSVLWVKK